MKSSYMVKLVDPAKLVIVSILSVAISACSSGQSSFSLLPTSQQFQQSNSSTSNKVDLLWVIDNSPSMIPAQANILNNISSFMTNFQSKNLDFKLAVTTTEAYLGGSAYTGNNAYSKFRNGATLYQLDQFGRPTNVVSYSKYSGIFVVIPGVPDLINTFITNAYQGDQGSGDERAFRSLQITLNESQNAGFHRPDAYLAVIILSDEDDFSGDSRIEGSWIGQLPGESNVQFAARYVPDHSYVAPTLDSVGTYISYLDTFTNSTASNRHYNVSAISVLDSACQATQNSSGSPNSIVGQRYMDIASQTNGTVGSLCDANFSQTLTKIQENILELSSQFFLQRAPIVSSITVAVNSAVIAQDPVNGWTYNSVSNAIVFHGFSIPPQGANIEIHFDPTTIK